MPSSPQPCTESKPGRPRRMPSLTTWKPAAPTFTLVFPSQDVLLVSGCVYSEVAMLGLLSLPLEVLSDCLSFLRVKEVIELRTVSRGTRDVCHSDELCQYVSRNNGTLCLRDLDVRVPEEHWHDMLSQLLKPPPHLLPAHTARLHADWQHDGCLSASGDVPHMSLVREGIEVCRCC